MPNKWTFKIPPIAVLICHYVGDGKDWIDPFAGMYSPAEFTNDLNPEMPSKYHMDALEFLTSTETYSGAGILFDPPYSLRQVKECYESLGRNFTMQDSQDVGRWTGIKKEIARIIRPSGYVISFGWNSQGVGKQNGFEIVEVLLVCHGAAHNDTICTVERKVQSNLIAPK